VRDGHGPRLRLAGHEGEIRALAFSADGRVLLCGRSDSTALVWGLSGQLHSEKGLVRLSNEVLSACWDDLASADSQRAYAALRRLSADPARSVPELGRRLRPAPAAEGRPVADLIADLDSDDFAVREKATAELSRRPDAAAALREALAGGPSEELRRRGREILAKWAEWPADDLRRLRAVEALELIGTPQARQVLEGLAGGAGEVWLTQEAKASLGRLERLSPIAP
jgi:hypothetical protein